MHKGDKIDVPDRVHTDLADGLKFVRTPHF